MPRRPTDNEAAERPDDGTDGDDDQPPERTMPWRAAAPGTPARVSEKPVLVEKWDDELPTPTAADELAAAARRAQAGFGPTVRHVANLLLFAAAVIGALAGLAVAWMHVVGDPLADAHAYYEAASRLNAGKALYPADIDANGNHIFLYPPLLAIALRPLAVLPFVWFALGWELIVVASFVALVRYLGAKRRQTWLAIGVLGVPIGWALSIAQAHVPMTYLLALGQPWSIAVAANLKLTPALIAIWWLGRRDYQSFFAFVLWSLLLVLAQVLLASKATFAYFGSIGFDQVGQVRNISPYAQSPVLWIVLVLIGALVTIGLARTRWGWAAAVTIATLAPPRLLIYMLTGLLAAIRTPKPAGEPDPDDRSDAVAAFGRAVR